MANTKKKQINIIWIVISGLALAVIVTAVIVGMRQSSDMNINATEIPTDPNIDQNNTIIIDPTIPISNSSTPAPKPSGSTCSTPRIRRSWTELNDQEKTKFINAVIQMKNKPSKIGTTDSLYDDFAAIHDVYKSFAHNISAFFPWHRHFINEFEKELQNIDSQVTLPYWDWARDSENPAASVVFANDAFGGDGDPQTGCVTNGAFANWQVSHPARHCLQRQFNGGRSTIRRWAAPSQVAALIFRFRDYSQFRAAFESTPHAAVHNALGGDMLQTYSPNDPIFWLHHANVDRYFYIWQIENPRSPYNGGSLRDRLIPFNIPVSDGFDLPSASQYCYSYSSGLGDTSPLNKRNLLKQRKVGELQCPDHIPDEFTLKMGCSLEHVRMTEKYICDFTKRLNRKKQLSFNIKIESALNYTNPKIWRYESGDERDMILECLE